MGKRADNKKYYQTVIPEAAKELFASQGYENTTMEQIAAKAGIGLGTAYNYYKSKDELFILTMAERTADDLQSDVADRKDDGGNVSDIVAEAVLSQIRKFNLVNKAIWKTALPIVFSTMKSGNQTLQKIMQADLKVMDTLRDLMNRLKKDNRLAGEFDTEVAIDLIFGAFMMQLGMYLYADDVSFEDVCEKIKADIRFVFQENKPGL